MCVQRRRGVLYIFERSCSKSTLYPAIFLLNCTKIHVFCSLCALSATFFVARSLALGEVKVPQTFLGVRGVISLRALLESKDKGSYSMGCNIPGVLPEVHCRRKSLHSTKV